MKILKKILLTLFIFAQITGLCCLAIEERKTDKPVSKILYNEVMTLAKDHAYDLKIANYNTQIAKTSIMGARSDYLPKLAFMAGAEYTKNFRNARESTVMSIGDAFINPYTRFQSVLGFTLSYNVFDFGLRRAKLDASKQDVHTKTLQEQRALQELELNLIDSYTKVLLAKRQLDLKEKEYKLEQQNLEIIERLYKAEQVSSTDVNDRKVKITKLEREVTDLTKMLEEALSWLSFYTGQDYTIEHLTVEDLPSPNFDTAKSTDYTQTVLWKYYDSEIKKKEYELKAVKRTNMPKVNAYSRYYFYGSDEKRVAGVFENFGPSNFSVGGNVTMPLFDGLKNYSDIKRTTLELEQLLIKRDKDVAEWIARIAAMRSNLRYLRDESDQYKTMVNELNKKSKSKERLLAKHLISPLEVNDTKIELLERQAEYEKNNITAEGILNGLKILTEAKTE